MAATFSEEELRAIVEATSGDFAGSTLAEHMGAALDLIKRTIHHTSLNVFLVRGGQPMPLCSAGLIDERGLLDYVSHYIQSDPMRTTFGDVGQTVSTLTGCARRQGVDLRRNEFLQDYAIPRYRIGDLLGSNLLVDQDVTVTFALHREPTLSRFAEREVAALQIAAPPLARALRVTYARERASEALHAASPHHENGTEEGGSAGVAVLDERLELTDISPVARRALREFEGDGTLDDVLALAGALVDRLRRVPDKLAMETALVRRIGDRSASIRILVTRSAPSRPVTVYLFVDLVFSKSQVLVARVAQPFGLSEREISTTALLQEGLNLTQIAARLDVKPQTVRACLLGIRRKLGVRTNAQILARLLAGA